MKAWSCECEDRKCPECNPEGKDLGNGLDQGLAFRESLGYIEGTTVKSEVMDDDDDE